MANAVGKDLVALSDGLFDHSHTVHSEARKFLKAARSRQVPQQSAELQHLATTAVPLAGTEAEPLLGEIVSQVRSICAEVRSEFMVGSAIQKEHRQNMKASSEEVASRRADILDQTNAQLVAENDAHAKRMAEIQAEIRQVRDQRSAPSPLKPSGAAATASDIGAGSGDDVANASGGGDGGDGGDGDGDGDGDGTEVVAAGDETGSSEAANAVSDVGGADTTAKAGADSATPADAPSDDGDAGTA